MVVQAGRKVGKQAGRQPCGEQERHPEVALVPAEVSQGDRRSWSVYACPHPPEPHATPASLELTGASAQEAEDLSVSATSERLMCSHLVSKMITG